MSAKLHSTSSLNESCFMNGTCERIDALHTLLHSQRPPPNSILSLMSFTIHLIKTLIALHMVMEILNVLEEM